MSYLVMIRFPGEPSEALACVELDPSRGILATFGDPDQGMPMNHVVAKKTAVDLRRMFPSAVEVFLREV